MATGDINGDTYDDILIGGSNVGDGFVVFGHADPWPTSLTVDTYVDGTKGFKVSIPGLSNYDTKLVAGDIKGHGNGTKDLIVANPLVGVWVYFGHATPWNDVSPLTSPPTGNAGARPGFALTNAGKVALGMNVAVGDVNHDGTPDLLVSDPWINGAKGAVYVIFGSDSYAWSSTFDLATLNGTNGFAITGVAANDAAGFGLAVADIYKDGYSDVLIGASNASPNSVTNAGSTYVLFGKKQNGWPASYDLNNLN